MDKAKAAEWLQKAAEQECAQAQYNLGICYFKGDGVSMDEAKAVEWWQKAAEQGNAEVIETLESILKLQDVLDYYN